MLANQREQAAVPGEILTETKAKKTFLRPGGEELVVPGAFAPPPAPRPSQQGAMNMQGLLAALKRRWMMAACFAVMAGTVAGVLGWVLVPNKFLAYATLQVSVSPNPIIQKLDFRNDFSVFMKTQAQRIKSRDVLLGALKQDQVRNLQIVKHFPDTLSLLTWLEDEIKIDFQDGNELLTVTVSGDEPEELVVLVNGLVNSYLEIINGKEVKEKKERGRKLQVVVDELREKLKAKHEKRQSLVPAGVSDHVTLAAKFQNYQSQLGDANKELLRLQFEEEKLNFKIVSAKLMKKTATEEDVPDYMIRPILETDPVMKDNLLRLQNASSAMARMRKAAMRLDDATYVATKAEYARLSGEIEKQRQVIRAETLRRVQGKYDNEHRTLLELVEGEKGPLQKQMKKIQERIELLKAETDTMGNALAAVEKMTQEIQQDEKKIGTLNEQIDLFNIEEKSDPRVSSCQDAVWQIKDARKRMIIVMLFPLFAVGAVCLGVAWFENRTGKIQSADEVADQFGLRVVGTIPPVKYPKTKKINSFFEMDVTAGRDLIESVDCIRTMILRRQTAEPMKLIMVTSAAGGEGKSTFAYNVAVSLAAMGKKTLLIDCDFRAPALHQVFEQTLQPGFCEILAGEVTYDAAIRPTTTHPNLFFLPAGQWDREVIQELATDTFSDALEHLKREYEFIIIDSHPLLAATDSLLIAQHVDTVLISVLRNVSRSPLVSNALSRLSALEVPVLGAVVSGIPPEMIRS